MCAWRVDHMAFFKNKTSILQRQQETKLFEYVMDEIANNIRNQGVWGQALVKANGDEKKAEAEYIKLRVDNLKDEILLDVIIEDEKLRAIQKMTLKKEAKKPKKYKTESERIQDEFKKGLYG